MKITILCSDPRHPVFPRLQQWSARRRDLHDVSLVTDIKDLKSGDILFLISCTQIINLAIREHFKAALVLHASDLPEGRGWSPHIWRILQGHNDIVVSMIEAEDKVDTGRIWHQLQIQLEGHELADEINLKLFEAELQLMDFAVENFTAVEPRSQVGKATYYEKRTPENSRLDVDRTLRQLFNQLRISDPDRFPAFFDLKGHRYVLRIEKEKWEIDDE